MKVADINDKVIRREFIKRNLDFFKGDNKEFVNEFGINSTNVVDIASFDFNNNIFYGFEIKSARDNVKRLRKQLSNYITFFNIVYVVAYEKHIPDILDIINSNKNFEKVGIIKVDKELNFEEIRQAKMYKQFFDKFISNLDLGELKLMCESKELESYGNKGTLITRLKRFTPFSEIYEGIHNKLRKFFIKKCSNCGSNLYYNKQVNKITRSFCYECDNMLDE